MIIRQLLIRQYFIFLVSNGDELKSFIRYQPNSREEWNYKDLLKHQLIRRIREIKNSGEDHAKWKKYMENQKMRQVGS